MSQISARLTGSVPIGNLPRPDTEDRATRVVGAEPDSAKNLALPALLHYGRSDEAWDEFLATYRALLFASIRHYTRDPDEVMDAFASVCEALRADDLARLRRYGASGVPKAKFTTWLVAVVRNLTVDWFRHRRGRLRRQPPAGLGPLEVAVYDLVVVEGTSHQAAFERLRSAAWPQIDFRSFRVALQVAYRAAQNAISPPLLREVAAPSADVGTTGSLASDEVEARELSARVQAALADLTPDLRAAILLFVVDEVAAEDVARVVGWPNAKAVYNRVYRALAALRAKLEVQGLSREDL